MTTTPADLAAREGVTATLHRGPERQVFVQWGLDGWAAERDVLGSLDGPERHFVPEVLVARWQWKPGFGGWAEDVRLHGPVLLKSGARGKRTTEAVLIRPDGARSADAVRAGLGLLMPAWVVALVDEHAPLDPTGGRP